MPKGANQKFKLYRLAQIMCEKTDETHYLTMPEIQKELEKYDIIAERRSLYESLKDLEEFGIEVEGERSGRGYRYHVIGRQFELAELKLLVDAIQSSKFITEKMTNRLIGKLETALGSQAKIVSPKNVVNQVRKKIEKLAEQYALPIENRREN